MITGNAFFSNIHTNIDLVFPARRIHVFSNDNLNFLYWIPDFQENIYPQFFTQDQLNLRKAEHELRIKTGNGIVFSSQTAKNDFNLFYPDNCVKQFVLPFAVTHPTIEPNYSLIEKYKTTTKFYICCNQFWQHKNHKIVLEAISEVVKKDKSIVVIFTGKEEDLRNLSFFQTLKELTSKLNVENNVRFLGLIDRIHQLQLMKMAKAVIQPSLFEGWSTVIEDAKSLNCPLIVSDLGVHQEQLERYGNKIFFDPQNSQHLASILESTLSDKIDPYDYQEDIKTFGANFHNIIETIRAK